jgi:thiamine-phosphate pyrophosphorylase
MKAQIQHLPRLFIVSSGREHIDAWGLAMQQATAISKSGPVMFQLREKGLEAAQLYNIACRLRPLLDTSGSLLLVNERADVALASGARGVHLPESSCPASSIRKAFPGLLAGQSVHRIGAAVDAWKSGVDYLLFGPVFATPSKERFGPPQGLEELEKVCRSVSIPVFAVGGITPEKSFACIEKGAWGIAAMTPFLDAGSLPATIDKFRCYLPS